MMMPPGSSLPAFVMRTGQILPITPRDARQDITARHVNEMTLDPPGMVQALLPAMPSLTTSAVAQTVTAVPPTPIQTPPTPMPLGHSQRHAWHLKHHRQHPAVADIKRLHPNANLQGAEQVELGEWQGRPMAKFQIAANPPAAGAQAAAQSLRRAAHMLATGGFSNLPAELIAGPLAALMRGGAVELHFQNGVVIRTAL